MSLAVRLPRYQGLGHTGRSRIRAGLAIGDVQSSPAGLSWLIEEQNWDRPHNLIGGLNMHPVNFRRLVDFLTTSSHTGMGHARHPFSQDVGGINALAVESAIDQAADEVIGPRHPSFYLEDL